MSPLIDPFARGLSVGALIIIALGVWRTPVSRAARIATALLCLSVSCWLITESPGLWGAFDHINLLFLPACANAGFFWLFVTAVFQDRPVNAPRLLVPAAFAVVGETMNLAPNPVGTALWLAFNGAGGLICLYVAVIIIRGWRDDLVEGRRAARAIVIGFTALFSVAQVVLTFVNRLDPEGQWLQLTVNGVYGGMVMAVVCLSSAVLFLQGRPSVFGASRRAEPIADARAEAADRQLLAKLEAFMTEGGWRKERLTIGAVAAALETPEHHLRRLINRRLGHRNFADFVNGHRIEAAKQRLADPGQARTTVAAIAFDLGYGSLGPFNRAFRAATGVTPTEWRRTALQASPNLKEAV